MQVIDMDVQRPHVAAMLKNIAHNFVKRTVPLAFYAICPKCGAIVPMAQIRAQDSRTGGRRKAITVTQ
ncbi:hypothetical protein DDT56_18790 [Brenneria corticis]|uniref:Uncharacterized protein n=1 Tax=Brenneria corticis TaxID=2173106 RepID=A0A2U1TQ89_9GAMM|nr:hypothetical protein DDT56_18790 [Brenneria sp. CFCC 11842]